MKYFFLIMILFLFFKLTINEGFVEESEEIDLKNIYGDPLKPCKKGLDNNGSWDNQGYCSEKDGGVHQICFNINKNTADFSTKTNQSDWSKNRINKNHCMCLGAWALYKAKQDKNLIDKTDNELVCESIPEMALEKRYVNKWNTWNGNELPDQIQNGLDALYNQCYNKTNDTNKKKFLKNKYNKLKQSIN